jgi:hypothetical protein
MQPRLQLPALTNPDIDVFSSAFLTALFHLTFDAEMDCLAGHNRIAASRSDVLYLQHI